MNDTGNFNKWFTLPRDCQSVQSVKIIHGYPGTIGIYDCQQNPCSAMFVVDFADYPRFTVMGSDLYVDEGKIQANKNRIIINWTTIHQKIVKRPRKKRGQKGK
jgi:hypothetical protein